MHGLQQRIRGWAGRQSRTDKTVAWWEKNPAAEAARVHDTKPCSECALHLAVPKIAAHDPQHLVCVDMIMCRRRHRDLQNSVAAEPFKQWLENALFGKIQFFIYFLGGITAIYKRYTSTIL